MKKYYTRVCNFHYGKTSIKLVEQKKNLPLNGNKEISFNQIEIISRDSIKLINIKEIKKLPTFLRNKVNKDIKVIVKKNKNKVWVYSFDRVRDGQKSKEMGAYHGAELPYIFNTHDEWLPTSAVDIEITKIIQDHWIEFIKNGNPNTKLFNVWAEHKLYKNNVISYNNKVISKTHDSSKICKKLIY